MRTCCSCSGAVWGCLGLLGLLATGLPMQASPTDAPKPEVKAPSSPDAFAQRAWAITSLVLEHHLDPPTRQEMVLSGIKGLFKMAGATPPRGLSQRISTMATQEQLTALMRDSWSQVGDKANASADKLNEALLDGLLSPVPGKPHRVPAEEVKVMEQIAGNRYVGIGVQLASDKDTNLVQIVTPLPRGPARRAGAKAGDLILQVDDKTTAGLDVKQVVTLIRGEEGTAVTVVVRQPDSDAPRTLKMIRGVIPFETILGYQRLSEENWQYRVAAEAPIAYLAVKSMTSSTLHELRQIERQLQAEGSRALVLDLRFTDGGHLQHTALFADGLLDSGLLWRLRDANNQVKEYQADRDCLFRDWPLAVLMTRAPSEQPPPARNVSGRPIELAPPSTNALLVTMALQDNGRAVVVGEPTQSDGYSNSLFPLPDGQGVLTLRTGRLERAKPTKDGWGVQPDHTVALNQDQRVALLQWQAANQRPERPADAPERAPEDPQLAKAVELLQAALKTKETPK